MIDRSLHFTPEIVASMVETKTAEVSAVLREGLGDESAPTEEALFRAEIEVGARTIGRMVARIRDPDRLARHEGDPRKVEIMEALAANGETATALFRTSTPDMTEARLAEATRELREHWRSLTEKARRRSESPPEA